MDPIIPDIKPETVYFTEEIVTQYATFAEDFTVELSLALMPGIKLIFGALIGVWIIIEGIKLLLGIRKVEEFPRELFFLIIAAMLLFGQGDDLINSIYSAALSMAGSVAGLVLNIGSNTDQPANIDGLNGMAMLVRSAEIAILKILNLSQNIALNWGLTNMLTIFYALLLAIPYFIILLVYFAQVVISIFRVIMLATLSPFLMLAFGFGWGRGMAMKAIKTLIATIMVLFGSTAAVAIILYGVTKLKIGEIGGMDIDDVSFKNVNFVLAVALGWLGTAFMAEATGIANSITEASLTNTAAAIITAAGAATGYAVMKQTGIKSLAGSKKYLAPAAAGGIAVGGAITSGAGAIGNAITDPFVDLDRNRFKNYKNAGLDNS